MVFLYPSATNIIDWTKLSAVWYFVDTATLTGFFNEALCNLAILLVMVAENKYVVLSDGITFKILSNAGPKSMSNNRSASSITKYWRFLSEKPLVCSKWSIILPGVATMMCGFLIKSRAWSIMSIPPTIHTDLKPISEPRASKVSFIWNANSAVGAKTSPKYGFWACHNAWRIGIAKAAVFPDPVCAKPMISLPSSACGMASAWIGVGLVNFIC